jgi:hypothetical protein
MSDFSGQGTTHKFRRSLLMASLLAAFAVPGAYAATITVDPTLRLTKLLRAITDAHCVKPFFQSMLVPLGETVAQQSPRGSMARTTPSSCARVLTS